MKIIGLCGGSGAGKSIASSAIYALGGVSIDTDRVYRELCVPGSLCLDELAAAFGEGILTSAGELDRPTLAELIYGDAEKRMLLNSITHKHIKSRTEALIEKYRTEGKSAVVVDAPLLFESEFDKLCDVTVGVTADVAVRVKRLASRDGIDEATAKKRIAAQLSDERLAEFCDFIIENNEDTSALYEKAYSLYESIIKCEV